ncbi:homocysteine S-methyltransferase [Occallatibacter savannae]|uniref:homocysteine S-methyltransferase n=1 Tax=Occallatibacter savannae TaxID=1002691 RepID=UPI000D696E0B|nr:homocysteine S-methyltransferase [Occallatibacter savannae]
MLDVREWLRDVRVLDGGLASELEYLGADINGPLWSAHVLEQTPEKIVAVHRAYIEAGAEIIETASYQVSRMGYAEVGLGACWADGALLRSVALAKEAARFYPKRRVLVAASLGPYGAALHNGAEYHGKYDCTFGDLVEFHRQRINVLASAPPEESADLLAFETLPSLAEAEAIGEALARHPELAVWFSFTCPDAIHVAHGELLRQCATAVSAFPQTVAVGVNCTHPTLIESLIGELRDASDKPVIVYPNSGEGWDAERRCWTGASDPQDFGDAARRWFGAGAQIIGGCCRTRPAHISAVAASAG